MSWEVFEICHSLLVFVNVTILENVLGMKFTASFSDQGAIETFTSKGFFLFPVDFQGV